MFLETIAIVGLGYIVYREYKSGKLATFVTALEARLASLESVAKTGFVDNINKAKQIAVSDVAKVEAVIGATTKLL